MQDFPMLQNVPQDEPTNWATDSARSPVVACCWLAHRALRSDPVNRLPCHRSDVIEVGVIVQDRRAIMLGSGRCKKVHHSGGTMLAPYRHQRLHLAGSEGDLVDGRKLDELAPNPEDPLVLRRIARRVSQLKIHGDEGGQRLVRRVGA